MKLKLTAGCLVVALFAAVYVPSGSATPASKLSTQNIGQAVFNALSIHARTGEDDSAAESDAARWAADIRTRGLTDLYVVDSKLAPGGTTGWHSHPGPSLILVVAGTVTNYASDTPECAGRNYTAGQGFVDAGGSDVHMLRNNGAVAAETIAVQFIPHGSPRKIDEAVPEDCHV